MSAVVITPVRGEAGAYDPAVGLGTNLARFQGALRRATRRAAFESPVTFEPH